MKIVALQAENVKRLVAVEIKPDGNLVQITGKNGNGKTSVLDSIWWALAGATHIQKTPIRTGAKTAMIRLDLGELVVTRTFRPGKHGGATSSITVQSKDGATFKSPQKMLDELLGALSFDPLAFAKMPPREQFDTMKKFVPGVNFDHLEQVTRGEFEKRTEINRKAKDVRSRASAIVVPADPPKEGIDEMALVLEIEEAGKSNTALENRKARRQEVRNKIDHLGEEILKLTKEKEELEQKLAEAPALPDPIDVSGIRAKLEKAREDNKAYIAARDKAELTAVAEKLEAEAQALTDSMEAREEEKRKAIAEAKLPVEGISFGAGEVLMDGVPFEQASDAEQLRVSVAIAMSLNPKLRVIRVRDGSLLDEDSLKLLADMADEKDYQVWIERVDGSGKVGFVLEDGHVRAAAVKA